MEIEKPKQTFRLIEESLLNALIAFMDEKPHKEVRGFMDALCACPPVEVRQIPAPEAIEEKEGKTITLKTQDDAK